MAVQELRRVAAVTVPLGIAVVALASLLDASPAGFYALIAAGGALAGGVGVTWALLGDEQARGRQGHRGLSRRDASAHH